MGKKLRLQTFQGALNSTTEMLVDGKAVKQWQRGVIGGVAVGGRSVR
jgi:hypothetical protein